MRRDYDRIKPIQSKIYRHTGAAIIAVAVAAYGLGRIYPPLGPTEGTIAPADRYVSSQVGEGDVTLGDTSIPKLMQTDAFEVMSKNPNFRTLASHPGFAALAAEQPGDGGDRRQSAGVHRPGQGSAGLHGDVECRPGRFGRGG